VRKAKFSCPLLFCLCEHHRSKLSLGLKIMNDAIGRAFETKPFALRAQPEQFTRKLGAPRGCETLLLQ
jgi:hypothetical protein